LQRLRQNASTEVTERVDERPQAQLSATVERVGERDPLMELRLCGEELPAPGAQHRESRAHRCNTLGEAVGPGAVQAPKYLHKRRREDLLGDGAGVPRSRRL